MVSRAFSRGLHNTSLQVGFSPLGPGFSAFFLRPERLYASPAGFEYPESSGEKEKGELPAARLCSTRH